jgi:hypothetical protein
MEIKETDWESVNMTDMFGTESKFQFCERGNETLGYTKCRAFPAGWETISFWRRALLHFVTYLTVQVNYFPVKIFKIKKSDCSVDTLLDCYEG